MTSYAASVTGLSRKQANEAFNDLKREGQHLPAPTDAEVDQFLERQEFQVRQNPDLSDAKRETIMNRLRAAIGRRLHLDGATFHAWKNIVAEAWARSRRKVALGFISAALVSGMAACGDAPKTPTPAPPPSVVATASAAPTVAPSPSASVAPLTISTDVANAFGQDKVQAAYQEMTDFTNKYAFDPAVMRQSTHTAADFAGPRDQMTDTMRSDWDSLVSKVIAGDKTAQSNMQGFSYYNLEGDGYTLAKSGPLVVNETITAPSLAVGRNSLGVTTLNMTLSQHGEVRFTKSDGSAVRYPYDKTITYHLVEAPQGSANPWLIDGFTSHYQSGSEVPDTTK